MRAVAERFVDALEANDVDATRRLGRALLYECARVDVSNEHAQAHARAVAADVLAALRPAPPSDAEHEALLADLDEVSTLMEFVLSMIDDQSVKVARLDDSIAASDADVERAGELLAELRPSDQPTRALGALAVAACCAFVLILCL